MEHTAILINNSVNTNKLANGLLNNVFKEIYLKPQNTLLFSTQTIDHYIDLEERLEQKIINKNSAQPLKTMSSGERKKLLLEYQLTHNPETMILVNPYDNLDAATQRYLKDKLTQISTKISIIEILTRFKDASTFIDQHYNYKDGKLVPFVKEDQNKLQLSIAPIPQPIDKPALPKELVIFNEVSVSYCSKKVLNNICWEIKPNTFWQLIGPNGSGKSTLLNMITGDNPMGYGQDLCLFGAKKGSGESVWDIKKKIGYFSPHMVDKFAGYHSLEHMLISGIHDSVGLYTIPTVMQKNQAKKWLHLLGMEHRAQEHFRNLSNGDKRLIMTARAMIKHPPLLILDEPTVGLDDSSANFFVALVNAYSKQSKSAILYVNHRPEPGLEPQFTYELLPSNQGSHGVES